MITISVINVLYLLLLINKYSYYHGINHPHAESIAAERR